MSERKKQQIADAAAMIVGGFAVLNKRNGYQIVNLVTGNVARVSKKLNLHATNMTDIELVIAIEKVRENLEFVAA